MWNLLKAKDDCSRFRILLENSAEARPEASSVEDLTAGLTDAIALHFRTCTECRDAAQDLLSAREIVRKAGRAAEPGPRFAERVMAAISAREQELEEAARTWLVVPRFASRLALASAALLVIASTWLYKRPSSETSNPPAATASPEYIFEAPTPPASQDDVLISMAERNP